MLHKNQRTIIIAALAALLITGCSSQLNVQDAKPIDMQSNNLESTTQATIPDYIIRPGDSLDIKFFYNKELNETVTVRPDGKISLQMIDEVRAAGITPRKLDRMLTKKYSKELKSPMISVIVKSFSNQKVFLGGEVRKQGMIDYAAGMTILQAVYLAEGFGNDALPSEAVVIRKDPENRPQPIRVNIKNIIDKDMGANFLLRPQDVVFIPRTAIAHANKFVNDYIKGLLMFNGFGVSFDYDIYRFQKE